MKKEEFLKLGLDEETAKKCEAASTEELKGYIPKTRFDEVNNEKKNLETTKTTLEGQLETLKNSTGDVETLKKTIADLQADNKKKDGAHAAELKKLKREAIDESILLESNAKNTKAVKALLDSIDDSVDEESYKTLRLEQVKKLKDAEDSKFLFDVKQETKPGFKGLVPGEKKDGVPGELKATSLADALKMHYSSDNTQ